MVKLRHIFFSRFRHPGCLWILLVGSLALHVHAQTTPDKPDGVVGWWHYINLFQDGYVPTPLEACKLSADNHLGVPLQAMTRAPVSKPSYRCYYKNPIGGAVWPYSPTWLRCASGYSPKWPGMCVKQAERAQAPSCEVEKVGLVCGNPVVVSTGAKLQTEADMPGRPNGVLRVTRTYRSMRDSGTDQSAGPGWSFSFDRSFNTDSDAMRRAGEPPMLITGTFGDGAYFEFARRAGVYQSQYDKRETLQSLNADFDDWALTNSDGRVDRFKKLGDVYLLISSHTREGAGQFYQFGPDNKLASISDGKGRALTVTWAGDVIASITGESGSVHYFHESGQLSAVEFRDGSGAVSATRQYHYEDAHYSHLLTGVTDENGARYATYAYDAAGQAVLSEHAGGAQRYTFSYPSATRRVITDPLGAQREMEMAVGRGSLSRVVSVSQPAGAGSGPAVTKLAYDAGGQLASRVDFNNVKSCAINEPARGLVTSRVLGLAATAPCPASATEPIAASARRISTQWHPDVALQTAVAGAREITRHVYNGQRDASGNVASCAENATLPTAKPIIVLCSKTVQATGDANGAQGFAAQPIGDARIWRYTYNAAGQMMTQTGPADASGQVASLRFSYFGEGGDGHEAGDLASVTNAAGETTHYLSYTAGLARRMQRPNGTFITMDYDAQGRIVYQSIDDGRDAKEETRLTYDRAGQLIRIVYPDGSMQHFDYDAAHRLIVVGDGTGKRVQMTRDAMGNVTRQEHFDSDGNVVLESKWAFDALNRLASIQRDALTPATVFNYDAGGNLRKITDPLGRVTIRNVDNFDRMVREILPPPATGQPAPVIDYGFDHQDQIVSVTDPRKLATHYTLDGHGQLTTLRSPDTGTSTQQIDGAGNVVASRDARGVTTMYRYDAAGRIVQNGMTSFEYGKNGTSAAGQLTTMIDESGKTTFTYDGLGRTRTKTQTVGTATTAKQFALAFTYGTSGSSTGHVTSMTYPSGNRIEIGYDSEGRQASISLRAPGSTKSVPILSHIAYSPLGAVQSWVWGDPASARQYKREFDAAGRLKTYPLGSIDNGGSLRTLSYDNAGRITSMKHAGTPGAAGLDQRYSYDELDRLTGVEGPGISQSYEYDANGNRTRARFGLGTYTNSIDSASNRLLRTSGPLPAKLNTFDAAGNLTSDGAGDYIYNANGRLTEVVMAGARTTYSHNGFGERVVKSRRDYRRHYVYDLAGKLIGEYDAAGNALLENAYLGDLPVAVLTPGSAGTATHAVYADHIMTPRVITRDDDNRILWRWDSADPFGLHQPDQKPSRALPFRYDLRFPGQIFDIETNTHYNYFRDYEPQTGRYIQSDPIGLDGGINTFTYVEGSPLDSVDPYGLQRGPMRLPRRVEAHNRWNDIHTQMKGEHKHWKDKNNLNYDDPLPVSPSPKRWCRMYCPSDSDSSCTPAPPGALPRLSNRGEMCAELCVTGPMFVNDPGAPLHEYQPQGGRAAGRGDAMRMGSMILGK